MTHALHFLPQVDYIYVVVEGRIAEQGTYLELMGNDGEFSKFVREFGSKEEEEKESEEDAIDTVGATEAEGGAGIEGEGRKKAAAVGPGLMQVEERNTGAISWEVYKTYSKAGNGKIVLPLLFLSLVLIQGATVMASYWFVSFLLALALCAEHFSLPFSTLRLVYWQER